VLFRSAPSLFLLSLDVGKYLREQRALRKKSEGAGQLVFEERGRVRTVRAPPLGGGLHLVHRALGELDDQRPRIRSRTASAGTPVPGTCRRIDSARNPWRRARSAGSRSSMSSIGTSSTSAPSGSSVGSLSTRRPFFTRA